MEPRQLLRPNSYGVQSVHPVLTCLSVLQAQPGLLPLAGAHRMRADRNSEPGPNTEAHGESQWQHEAGARAGRRRVDAVDEAAGHDTRH